MYTTPTTAVRAWMAKAAAAAVRRSKPPEIVPCKPPAICPPELLAICPAEPPAEDKKARRRYANAVTLPGFFDQRVWPWLAARDRREGSRLEYSTTLQLWAAGTENPVLAAINQSTCDRFRQFLQSRGIRPATIRKHGVNCNYVLRLAEGGDPKHGFPPLWAWNKDNVCRVTLPEPHYDEICDHHRLTEIWAWMEAGELALEPGSLSISPAEFWRSLILFAYNTGLRINTVMKLRREDLDAEGWLHVRNEIAKGGRGGRFYCNRWARAAIDRLAQPTIDRIVPWQRSMRQLHRTASTLLDVAGVRRHAGATKRAVFHGLRKALISWLAGENWIISQMVAGHRGGVTQYSYVRREKVIPFLERVPQPGQPGQEEQLPDENELEEILKLVGRDELKEILKFVRRMNGSEEVSVDD